MFNELALRLFRMQAEKNPVYRQFIEGIGVNAKSIDRIEDIPFLPIELFKSHSIITGNDETQEVFTSSGTTGQQQSRHYVTDVSIYEESYRRGFQHFYGDVSEYVLVALLPSYLEREGSSLIYMADDLVKQAAEGSAFYLHNKEELAAKLEELKAKENKILLLGVTYALLDLADEFPVDLSDAVIMETGGM